ncbi:Palmitoyltransferase [Aphelenchoides fujianensis]|nr:Palmitoyltransferase [Aphelenchoides fujianensis]
MASWYSYFYAYVRRTRQERPVWGFVLHLLLNAILVGQLIVSAYVYYVYTFVVCGRMLTSALQVAVYLCVFNMLAVMVLWSLVQTIRTPVSQVPEQYKGAGIQGGPFVDLEVDAQLKQVTPFEGGRFHPDKSTAEQAAQQHAILAPWVQRKRLEFAETDFHGRYRYCYQCSLLKPDRAHHCSSCGFCVVRFDHHCPYINKCVSHGNYKFFMLYIIYGCAFILWALVTSLEAWARYFVNREWRGELADFVQITVCLVAFGVFGYFPFGELLLYHLKLIAVNETTCEQAKVPIIRGDPKANYDFGRYANFRAVFGWGLWAFPVDTRVTDGLHHAVHYSVQADENEKLTLNAVRSVDSRSTVTLATTTPKSTNVRATRTR